MTTEPTKETPMSDEVNEVTQADIDAAEEHYPPLFWKKAARDDLALAFARYRTAFQASAGEGLRIARGIVEADLADAKEHCDADWIGLSQAALDAIDATLTTPVEASQPVGDAGEDWIAHNGGDCPVDPTATVEIKLRGGSVTKMTAEAVNWRYGTYILEAHCTMPAFVEVVAYRLATLSPPTSDERLRDFLLPLAEAFDAHKIANERTNAAIPALNATRAEREVYDERYRASEKAKRNWHRAVFDLINNDSFRAELTISEGVVAI